MNWFNNGSGTAISPRAGERKDENRRLRRSWRFSKGKPEVCVFSAVELPAGQVLQYDPPITDTKNSTGIAPP